MEFIKNPIFLKEYKTDSGFRLVEAKNNWISFRSEPSSYVIPGESKPRPTIDLILLGAIFIELPTCFNELKLTKPKDNLSKIYAEKYDKNFNNLENKERVYAIESQGNRFHIVTANLWILIHKERTLELPLNYFYDGDLKRYNDYLENYVEKWIKIE